MYISLTPGPTFFQEKRDFQGRDLILQDDARRKFAIQKPPYENKMTSCCHGLHGGGFSKYTD